MNGYKVGYYNLYRLFEEINLARISSTLHRFFAKLAQTDLLILDDFGMKVLDGQQLLDFMEIIEDRHGQNATIIISAYSGAYPFTFRGCNSPSIKV